MLSRISQTAGRHLSARSTFACVRCYSSETSSPQSDKAPSFPILAGAIKDQNYRLVSWLISEQDPYEVRRVKMPALTTSTTPNLVASETPSRMIGCVCEPEADAINWFELKKGDPVQCYCGHWFQLVSYEEYLNRRGLDD